MKIAIHRAALTATLGAVLASGAIAQPSPAPRPPIERSGAVEYLSGGIGADESAALQKEGRQWPLTLEFAIRDKSHAVFAADVTVRVRDAGGRTVLDTTAAGPFMLVKLPPGRYVVEATLAAKTLRENVAVKKGLPARALFVWPAGTDETRS